jgi:hypothetical protein
MCREFWLTIGRTQPDTIRIKVKNVPLSADDEQIHGALTLEGCEIQGLFRERLSVDGKSGRFFYLDPYGIWLCSARIIWIL